MLRKDENLIDRSVARANTSWKGSAGMTTVMKVALSLFETKLKTFISSKIEWASFQQQQKVHRLCQRGLSI